MSKPPPGLSSGTAFDSTRMKMSVERAFPLLYGQGSVKKSGLHGTVPAALEKEGIKVVEMSGVAPNPRLSLARKGIALCRKESVDFILAVGGGGSVIDTAKAIVVGVPYDGDVWDFSSKKTPPSAALPIGVVLTIPAAGSETSQYAVITNDEVPYPLKRDVVYANHEPIRPRFAILDPELTLGLPPYQTACRIVDIMSHVIERYFTSTPNVDFTDREGDWSSHAIEHELSAVYDIAHGAGLAIVMPSRARHVCGRSPGRFAQFAVRVWNVEPNSANPERTAREGIAGMEQFFKEIGMPTRLSEAKIDSARFQEMAGKLIGGFIASGSATIQDSDDIRFFRRPSPEFRTPVNDILNTQSTPYGVVKVRFHVHILDLKCRRVWSCQLPITGKADREVDSPGLTRVVVRGDSQLIPHRAVPGPEQPRPARMVWA